MNTKDIIIKKLWKLFPYHIVQVSETYAVLPYNNEPKTYFSLFIEGFYYLANNKRNEISKDASPSFTTIEELNEWANKTIDGYKDIQI